MNQELIQKFVSTIEPGWPFLLFYVAYSTLGLYLASWIYLPYRRFMDSPAERAARARRNASSLLRATTPTGADPAALRVGIGVPPGPQDFYTFAYLVGRSPVSGIDKNLVARAVETKLLVDAQSANPEHAYYLSVDAQLVDDPMLRTLKAELLPFKDRPFSSKLAHEKAEKVVSSYEEMLQGLLKGTELWHDMPARQRLKRLAWLCNLLVFSSSLYLLYLSHSMQPEKPSPLCFLIEVLFMFVFFICSWFFAVTSHGPKPSKQAYLAWLKRNKSFYMNLPPLAPETPPSI